MRKARDEGLCFNYGIESLQGKLVYIIFLIRHKDVANKQVTSMGFYFRGRGKKRKFYPIMGLYMAINPISRSLSGNSGLSRPIAFEVNHG